MAYKGATNLPNRRQRVYTGRYITIDFELNRAGIAKIAVGNELRDAVHSVAEHRAKPYAIGISPRSDRKHKHYADSFQVRNGYTTIAGMRRVTARLWNTSDHSVEVEFINGSRILGKTLAYLNHDSVLAALAKQFEASARAKKFNPAQHPRGARGRFIPRTR